MSNALYQFTMRGDNLPDLQNFAPKMLEELRTIPVIADVSSDQQDRGLQSLVQYDRTTAARFGISPQLIDNTLYDAFGQRQVSTMYATLESVSRGHGGGAGILAGPAVLEPDLCARPADNRFR
jgi:multidrug efflux pump subunit AcrB